MFWLHKDNSLFVVMCVVFVQFLKENIFVDVLSIRKSCNWSIMESA